MKKKLNSVLARAGIIFLILMFVSSAGCIKYLPTSNGGDKGTQPVSPEPTVIDTPSPSADLPVNTSPAVPPAVVVTAPTASLKVAEVDPNPYITPDPYALPYRSHGNRTTGEPGQVTRIPEFTKNIVLHSNSTVFRVNVTKGPLVIDLTYKPRFSNPDQTNLGSAGSEESGSSGVSMNSFVFSNSEVTVIDEISGAVIAKEGYGGVYSSDLEKKITTYGEGPQIITLKGNFIEVTMAITTGSAPELVTPAPTTSEYGDWQED